MRPLSGMMVGIVLLCSAMAHAGAASETDPAVALQARVAALQACFEARLRTLPDIVPTALTYHYVVDRLADPEVPWEHGSVEAVCDGDLFAPYLRAYDDMRIAARLPWAMPGTWGLDSESRLINFLTRRGPYGHVLGHSDITSQSLSALEGPTPSADALNLLGRASQAPDVYAWSTTTLHAHTTAPIDGVSPEAIAVSREEYVQQAVVFLAQFERLVRAGDDARALFALGLVLHGVQDLAYHRGMTFAEHSGLAYYLGLNPDILPEPDFSRVFAEAETLTRRVLHAARHHVGETVWARLMAWQQPSSFDMHAMARRMVPESRDVTFGELMEYWRLSLKYRYGDKARQAQLQEAIGGRWEPVTTLSELLLRAEF